ncbi:MAG: HPr family phosphocarrier protein [Clostridium sp.]|nr:HPr family phosphocarrier protein [Clostridium sp.]
MEKISVLLNSIDKVRDFVNIAGSVDCNFDLKSGRYIIDGKSIMGIFSLDLSQPLEVVGTHESDRPELVDAFQNFIYQ